MHQQFCAKRHIKAFFFWKLLIKMCKNILNKQNSLWKRKLFRDALFSGNSDLLLFIAPDVVYQDVIPTSHCQQWFWASSNFLLETEICLFWWSHLFYILIFFPAPTTLLPLARQPFRSAIQSGSPCFPLEERYFTVG